ncbi:MAG: LLM class flavin-dependent oxidoreductase [Bacillota bacterium]
MTTNKKIFVDFPMEQFRKAGLSDHIDFISKIEQLSFEGVYYNYSVLEYDPWIIATAMRAYSGTLTALIGVQPNSILPSTVAKMIETYVRLLNGKVDINLFTGGGTVDHTSIGDLLNKRERYQRLIEYALVLKGLLSSEESFSFKGKYYRLSNFKGCSGLASDQMPHMYISSSFLSSYGKNAAIKAGDGILSMPGSVKEYENNILSLHTLRVNHGIRISIITRPEEEDALERAARTPLYRERIRAKKILGLMSDSLDEQVLFPSITQDCALLVGSYSQVSNYIERYFNLGVEVVIVGDMFGDIENISHCRSMFRLLGI